MPDISKVWVADFETTTEVDFIADGCVRVILWHARNLSNDDEMTGFDIDSFIEWAGKVPSVVWFHNLKFDGSYIINRILNLGWTQSATQQTKQRTFSTIITNQGAWMQIKLMYGRHVTKILDSVKKFPGWSLEKISKIYGIEGKSNYDVYKRRDLNYIPSEEDIERVRGDTRILKVAMLDLYNHGFNKMTLASDCMQFFKYMYNEGCDPKKFKKLNTTKDFPQISLELDKLIRQSYGGGWVYVNPIYQGQDLENVAVYDVNSMHASRMYFNPLPFGLPYMRDRPYEGELYTVSFDCIYEIKPGFLPTIALKGSFRATQAQYSYGSKGMIDHLCLTSIDYELFKEHYNVIYEDNHQYICFRSKIGMFKKYIDYWMGKKVEASETGDEPGKQQAKRMLVSLYGKFGENPERTSKIPELKENGSTTFTEISDTANGGYLPIATFITAYARDYIIRSAQRFGKDFVYADTDSIHAINSERHAETLNCDDSKLGFWKLESISKKARYIRPKAYIHINESEFKKTSDGDKYIKLSPIEVKCGGMSDHCKEGVTWDNFRNGASYEGKLMGKQVKGGYLLSETTYNIKIMDR